MYLYIYIYIRLAVNSNVPRVASDVRSSEAEPEGAS